MCWNAEYIPLQLDDDDNSCGVFLEIESSSREQPSTISNNIRSVLVIDQDGMHRWQNREREDVQPSTMPGYDHGIFAVANYTDRLCLSFGMIVGLPGNRKRNRRHRHHVTSRMVANRETLH